MLGGERTVIDRHSTPIVTSVLCFIAALVESKIRSRAGERKGTLFKAGVHLKAVFTPLKISLMEISRSRFNQYKNPMLKTQINVLGCFVNFLVIFRYIW